jgi:prophage DNA circulation protein
MPSSPHRQLIGIILVVLILVAVLLAGCGSSTPAYCSKVSDLKKSVQDAAKLETLKKGTSGVSSAVENVRNAANGVVSAAKSDFPGETSALTSAVDTLSKSAQQLSSSPAATLATLPGNLAAATTAVNNFANATSSKCG